MSTVQPILAPAASASSGFSVPTGCAVPRAHFVRMFKPQFAPMVENGTKLQTVRPRPKRMPKEGDAISLRCWTGGGGMKNSHIEFPLAGSAIVSQP